MRALMILRDLFFIAAIAAAGYGTLYLLFTYTNPIVAWLLSVIGFPAVLLCILVKIDPDGYSDDDYEVRPRKSDDEDDGIYMIDPPPLVIGYGVWSVHDDD